MSARGSSIGANDLTRAPYYAPHTEQVRRDFEYPTAGFLVGPREGRLPESSPAAAVGGELPVQGERLSHTYSTSMQSGIHTSPGLFATVTAGAHGEESPRNSFTQFLIDTMAIFVAITFVLVTGIGFGFAIFALMFMSFH